MTVRARLAEAARARAQKLARESTACAARFYWEGRDHECSRPYGVECSRTYDPGPAPDDERLYVNTPLGVLWGLTDIDYDRGKNPWHAELAGWTLTRGES